MITHVSTLYSSFDENMYTKRLEMGSLTKAQMKRAEKIAWEITSSSSTNIHIREERGQTAEQVLIEDFSENILVLNY